MEPPSPKPLEVKFSKFMEYIAIVGCGLYLHLNRISILDLKITRLPGMIPSFASTIFIFSVLSLFAIGKPSWPNQAQESRRLIKFLIELSLIMYSVDLLMRHFWVPTLKVLSIFCKNGSWYLKDKHPVLSSWVADNGFFLLKTIIAMLMFLFMLEVIGFQEAVKEQYSKIMNYYNCKKCPQPVPVVSVPEPVQVPVYQRRTRNRSKRRAYDHEHVPEGTTPTLPLFSNFLQSPRVRSVLDIVRLNRNCNQCAICRQSL